MGIKLRVSGPRACFTRPELHVEGVSYPTVTPTAAIGILSGIYFKPEIRWVIDGIHVLNPIRTTTLKRNMISDKVNPDQVIKGNHTSMDVCAKRDQRNASILLDVDYVIEAHFDIVSGENNPGKHISIFLRRAARGQCFAHPYFGCREFSVEKFYPIREAPASALKGTMDLGLMLHSIDYEKMRPAFFNAVLQDGYMKVPAPNSSGVKR